jgi:hypothetical protein
VINHIDNFLSEEQNVREQSLQKLFWKVGPLKKIYLVSERLKNFLTSNVVDLHRFGADPDPYFHVGVVPDPDPD